MRSLGVPCVWRSRSSAWHTACVHGSHLVLVCQPSIARMHATQLILTLGTSDVDEVSPSWVPSCVCASPGPPAQKPPGATPHRSHAAQATHAPSSNARTGGSLLTLTGCWMHPYAESIRSPAETLPLQTGKTVVLVWGQMRAASRWGARSSPRWR